MNKKQMTVMVILTLVLAFMDISGLPVVLFVHCSLSDVTPYIISLLLNFLIIGFFAWLVLRSFGKDWPLGLHASRLAEGLKKYAFAGVAAGILSCVTFIIGLAPFDYQPSVWKVLIEGVLYYFGVAMIEELYVRGLFLNIVDKIAHKRENHAVIAIWVSSVIFGLGHIPGMIGMEPLVIIFKVISTIGMGLYFGAIYKRTNNLWVPIILHAFIDICALPYCFTTFSGYKSISLIGLVIIYTLLGIYSIVLMKTEKR
ncbi:MULTISPECIES: CPBP family intramembrane glutamic endopeptidase [unclassified Ruminococcus]|uniref:CPBP family intramembrane glutamic endopeptidase n=1 Tax=unclassified Ruminococcus TaxID=2608920 RepID=UPI00210A78E3|nr:MULTISPECIES: CPBP family intramembrane glutamic endopeptidase [unclassified Ruminococcus]MCQ4022368.1 CPBP family intramembrane metalloprotease [Ruminococcus sp. zg-924]MCQ4114696.1 CPBP family intramembrane metalloprotease [Ruminococcus sp. zg-921]